MVVHLAVAGDVFDGVLFCAVLFPPDVLDEIRDCIASVPEHFPRTLQHVAGKLHCIQTCLSKLSGLSRSVTITSAQR